MTNYDIIYNLRFRLQRIKSKNSLLNFTFHNEKLANEF